MRELVIMRGLPGSGKSTTVKRLIENQPSFVVCSADHFFTGSDGVYRFDPTLLREAHAQCLNAAVTAMLGGVALVVIDNTNIKKQYFSVYLEQAEKHKYAVKMCQPDTPWAFDPQECFKRNKHGVPLEVIQRMAGEWEILS